MSASIAHSYEPFQASIMAHGINADARTIVIMSRTTVTLVFFFDIYVLNIFQFFVEFGYGVIFAMY